MFGVMSFRSEHEFVRWMRNAIDETVIMFLVGSFTVIQTGKIILE